MSSPTQCTSAAAKAADASAAAAEASKSATRRSERRSKAMKRSSSSKDADASDDSTTTPPSKKARRTANASARSEAYEEERQRIKALYVKAYGKTEVEKNSRRTKWEPVDEEIERHRCPRYVHYVGAPNNGLVCSNHVYFHQTPTVEIPHRPPPGSHIYQRIFFWRDGMGLAPDSQREFFARMEDALLFQCQADPRFTIPEHEHQREGLRRLPCGKSWSKDAIARWTDSARAMWLYQDLGEMPAHLYNWEKFRSLPEDERRWTGRSYFQPAIKLAAPPGVEQQEEDVQTIHVGGSPEERAEDAVELRHERESSPLPSPSGASSNSEGESFSDDDDDKPMASPHQRHFSAPSPANRHVLDVMPQQGQAAVAARLLHNQAKTSALRGMGPVVSITKMHPPPPPHNKKPKSSPGPTAAHQQRQQQREKVHQLQRQVLQEEGERLRREEPVAPKNVGEINLANGDDDEDPPVLLPPPSPQPTTIALQFSSPKAFVEKLTLSAAETYPCEKSLLLLGLAALHFRDFLVKVIRGEVLAIGGVNLAVFHRPDGKKQAFLDSLPDPTQMPACEGHEQVSKYLEQLVGGVAETSWTAFGPETTTEKFRKDFSLKVVVREFFLQYHLRRNMEGGMEEEEARTAAKAVVDTPEFIGRQGLFD